MKTSKLYIVFALVLASILSSCNGIEIQPTRTYKISGTWKSQASKTIHLERVRPRQGEAYNILGNSRKVIGSTIVSEDGSFKIIYNKVDTTRFSLETSPVRLDLGGVIRLEPNKNVIDIDR